MIKKIPIDRISLNKDYSDNDLNTLKALIIGGAYYLSHFCTSTVASILFIQLYGSQLLAKFGKTDITEATKEISNLVYVIGGFTGDIIAAIVVIFLSKKLIKLSLSKRRIVDAAWVRGNLTELFQGATYGIFIFFLLLIISGTNERFSEQSNNFYSEQVFFMVKTFGIWFALIYNTLLFFISCPIEELIFRGLLLGGITRNYGLTMGIVFSTILFIVFHYPISHLSHIVHYLILSIATIILRLKTKAIGPSISYHLTYNLAVLIFTIISIKAKNL